MAVFILGGPRTMGLVRDREGNREYKVAYQVACGQLDGPSNCLFAPGLPRPGDPWLIDNDFDLWAFCKLDVVAKQRLPAGEVNRLYDLEFTFSSKGDEKRCKDQNIDDPLLVPDRISGAFSKYTEEQSWDLDGNLLVNSAWELFRGPQVEMDLNRPTVKIEKNVAVLNLDLLYSMSNCVNGAPLWGFGPRCVKLSNISWDRKFYGRCYEYYTWNLDFDINPMTFDRNILDEGCKVLNGKFDPVSGNWVSRNVAPGVPANRNNPQHFIRFKDRAGENCRVILNGAGMPAGVTIDPPWSSTVPYPTGATVNRGGRRWQVSGKAVLQAIGVDPIGPNSALVWTNIGSSSSGNPGNRFTRFYPEADFTLLGIPILF